MSAAGNGGYIAISRAIFDHPLFADNHSFSRMEAWQWLLGKAAWKPRARRVRHQVFHLERGQWVTSVRELAAAWRWPKSNVACFLRRLAHETMIITGRAVNGTATGTATRTAMTLITICNFDENQFRQRKPGQQPGQQPGQDSQQPLPLVELFGTEPNNHSNHLESLEVGHERVVRREKPKDGARGRGMIWADHKGQYWTAYANDYHAVTGSIAMPVLYIGGRGRWFREHGEASKRQRKRA